jgi:hypothetical protein
MVERRGNKRRERGEASRRGGPGAERPSDRGGQSEEEQRGPTSGRWRADARLTQATRAPVNLDTAPARSTESGWGRNFTMLQRNDTTAG